MYDFSDSSPVNWKTEGFQKDCSRHKPTALFLKAMDTAAYILTPLVWGLWACFPGEASQKTPHQWGLWACFPREKFWDAISFILRPPSKENTGQCLTGSDSYSYSYSYSLLVVSHAKKTSLNGDIVFDDAAVNKENIKFLWLGRVTKTRKI